MKIIPVILSGGSGSRLWPVSREGHPKPFMKLADGQSLLEKTYRRASSLPGVYLENGIPKILTVTNRDYYFISRDELDKVGVLGSFLLEPCSRNTAPAITLAAHRIAHKFGPDALMLVLAADHLIQDNVAFASAVESAINLASSPHNFLVTFGIVPDRPETGFGYIEAGDQVEGGMRVKAFTEKPDFKTAEMYLSSGNYFWNSGMFCFSAGEFLRQLKLCEPSLAKATQACWDAIQVDNAKESTMIEIPEAMFNVIPNISVDYAVMEKSSQVAVVPSNFGWNDIGSWDAIQDLIKPDENNNRSLGEAIFVNTVNTFVHTEDRLVATIGIENLMIIDTRDALLVANPKHAQDVKKVFNLLKQKNHNAYKQHQTITRPWGTYTVLEDHPGFKIKRIEVKPNGKLSLQVHRYRSEHWVVVKGQAHITIGEEKFTLSTNQSTFIPAGHKHRLENCTSDNLVIIEVQCGEYLGEDDIVRFDDGYGRI